MRINYNVSAMLANNALANNDSLLAKSLERLSSGLKINNAKDNPSGLAMAKRMNAQLEGLSVANQNAGDGVSVIEIADGALSEVHNMLQRMNELAVQAAHGPLTDEDRETIQMEVAQLKEEIARISETTEFNGQPLLNGEFDRKGYTDNLEVKVATYSTEMTTGEYTIKQINLTEKLNDNGEVVDYTLDGITLGDGFPADAEASVQDYLLTIKGGSGFEMVLDLSGVTNTNIGAMAIDVTGIGAMRLQVGANEGQVLEMAIPDMSLRNLGIEKADVSTKEGAEKAIESIEGAIKFTSKIRARLGAYQNRLESTIDSLDIVSENITAAYSRIMDTDMAEEMTNYTSYQVMAQAGMSMLAQANERPSQVLQLLQ